MAKIKCPNCRVEIDEDKLKKEFYKIGRKAKCPECNKWIIFFNQSKTLRRDPLNPKGLVKRFPSVKAGKKK